MSPARFLTERQWLGWFAAKLGLSLRDVTLRIDLDALRVATQAPLRVARGDRSDKEYFVSQLALQLLVLMARPPFRFDSRRVAFDTISLVCGMNGARLKVSMPQAFANERQAQPSHEDLERWVGENLVQLTGRQKIALQMKTFAHLRAPMISRPVFFVSAEYTTLDSGQRADLAYVVPELRASAERLIAELHTCWPVEDAIASDENELSADDAPGQVELWAPAVEHPGESGPQICSSNRKVLWRTSAHITLAPSGGSQGTGEERGMTPLDSRHLFIHYGDDDPSPAIDGNLSGRHLTYARVEGDAEVGAAFERWMHNEWPLIALAWRQADYRTLQYGPLADAFAQAFNTLGESQRRATMALAGLDERTIDALTDPHGLNWMGPDAYGAAAATLGFRASDYVDRRHDPSLSREQWVALLKAVQKVPFTEREARVLASEAERQNALGLLRFALTSLGDWVDFREQLRAEGAWTR